jgi:hypothetical protein
MYGPARRRHLPPGLDRWIRLTGPRERGNLTPTCGCHQAILFPAV